MSLFLHRAGLLSSGGGFAGGGGTTDPNFANVSALLHFDGADGSTTITDSSSNGFTFTANGNAQIDTAQSKFGGSSALFDGAGDFVSTADNAAFELGGGQFTIETWLRIAVLPSGSRQTICGKWGSGVRSYGFDFGDQFTTGQALRLIYSTNGSGASQIEFAWSPSANTWYHVALTRDASNDVRAFVDGTQVGTTQTVSATFFDATGLFRLGQIDTTQQPLNGWLDDFRLTKGVARYTANFTPPTAAFPDS